jgi:tetratricopeptide (TPR) repeat protein
MAPEAKRRFERGLVLFEAKRYDEAIAEFDAAYKLDPRREILFAWAQTERLSGDCPSAVILYRRFLDSDPEERHAVIAREKQALCERSLSTRPEGAPTEAPSLQPAPAPTPSTVTPTSAVRVTDHSPWYEDVLGDALLGTGVVGLGIGTWGIVSSVSENDAANAAVDSRLYNQRIDRAQRDRTIGIVGLAGGGAFVAAAIFRYATRSSGSEPDEAIASSLWLDGDATGFVVRGQF